MPYEEIDSTVLKQHFLQQPTSTPGRLPDGAPGSGGVSFQLEHGLQLSQKGSRDVGVHPPLFNKQNVNIWSTS